MDRSTADAGLAARRFASVWLFPVSYVAHATEEYCCGETFPAWISRVASVHFTSVAFLWLNGVALTLMLGAAWLATRERRLRLLVATLATIVTMNGVAHAVGSIVTSSYSPGVVTGTLLWLPLGGVMLRQSFLELPRRVFGAGVGLGVLAHAAVSAIVFASGVP